MSSAPLRPEVRTELAALPREEDNPWVIRGVVPGTHLTDLQRLRRSGSRCR